jgi:hypothetical protein
MSLPRRGRLRAPLATLVAALLAVLVASPAQAADYRFWAYYQLSNGSWAFAQKAPADVVPTDGSVEGWRFAVGGVDSSRFPRDVLTFDEVCGAAPAEAGKKRVGIVVDFGRAADSADGATPPDPKAVCAVVPEAATSLDVLKSAGELRSDKGMVCGVAGYPAADCGGEVKVTSAEAKAADTPVAIAAPGSTPSASATGAASDAAPTSAAVDEDGNTTAYVIAGLALLALVAFLLVRSRSGARRAD